MKQLYKKQDSKLKPHKDSPTHLEFENNELLIELFGPHEKNLRYIETELEVGIATRGNTVTITGPAHKTQLAEKALNQLYTMLEEGKPLDNESLSLAIHSPHESGVYEDVFLSTKNRVISARSPMQAEYIEALKNYDLVLALGPAGTGKTYLAVALGVQMMLTGQVDRMILSRPAVEAGEKLGFLPGDMREKVDPYLRPLYDALHDMLPMEQVARKIAVGEIEVAPLAFMRGRTLSNSVVILDEAQNTTPVQMKMFLTRMGNNTRMIVTGDLSQIDLPKGTTSGLSDAVNTLQDVKGISTIELTKADVVRHPLVSRIVEAYDAKTT